MSGNQRLANLLALANQGPSMRAALAEEVADLLASWPTDCPPEMRIHCEILLKRAMHEVDEETRARLRARLQANPALAMRFRPREELERELIDAARSGQITPCLAQALGISESRVLDILCDSSGQALVIVARILGLSRSTFSSLVLLSCPIGDDEANERRLRIFERLSASDAAEEWRRWTGKAHVAA
jgi:DNA-binding CsgD family transcriptional regulator